jgi:hypothetical protein
MDFIFELLARMAVKSGLRSLFRTPVDQWGATQWAIALALLAAVAGAIYWFFFRRGQTVFEPFRGRKRRRF